ncbi:MAG: molybdopterin-dependent oxidoreductase [Candidatus Bathyarchaeia archaeon]|nr:molybdopterin-dependent oxidoreductase [Candidatus Bathyarchaeota archaeon]
MKHLATVCPRDCYDSCFMQVAVDDSGKPMKVIGDKDNPITQGFLCPRGVMDIKRTYSSQRVLYPYRRLNGKPEGTFKRISWSEALQILVEKIRYISNQFGPDQILLLHYCGNMGLFTLYLPQRLFYALGSSMTDLSICSEAGHEALALHYGLSYGVDPEELPRMKLIVYWGFNAAVSAPHLHSLSLKARKNGANIIVIDPRKTETAKTADFWIQPKPASDVALAYGVIKHLIDKDLVDFDFIQKYTYGFSDLKREVSKLSVNSIEEYTGVKWSQIIQLAELYASCKPNVTMIGIGLQKSINGAEAVRAISLIPALVGIHRGFYYTNSKGWNIDLPYLTGKGLTTKKIRVVSQVALGKHLERGEFKLVYIYNMNPAETLPNQQTVRRGLSRDDVFVVVHDTHWTATAKYADLVLPAPTFLEKEDIVLSYSHRYVRKSNAIIQPLGESRSELWVTSKLAKMLNLNDKWLYEDPWKAAEKALKDAFENGSFDDLKNGETLKLKFKPMNLYQTPTGKIEFYATKAKELNLTPLPRLQPDATGELTLLNTAISKYTNSQFQDVYGPKPPIVLMNPADAEAYNIKDNDIIELYNEFGSIKLKAIISMLMPKNVLWMPREGDDVDGKPRNLIITDETQKLAGGPTFNSTKVKISKAKLTRES